MKTYYLILIFTAITFLFFVIRQQSSKYIDSSSYGNKVLPIFLGLGLTLGYTSSYLSLLASILPLCILTFFISYRTELKKFASSAHFIGSKLGRPARIFYGFIVLAFTLAALYEESLAFWKIIRSCNQRFVCIFGIVLLIYLAIIVGWGNFHIIAWHQIILLTGFVLYYIIDSNKNEFASQFSHLFAFKLESLAQIRPSKNFGLSMLLITPLQAQVLWLFEDKKYTRRNYNIAISATVYCIVVSLLAMYFTSLLSSSSFEVIQKGIWLTSDFYIGAIFYQLFFIVPLIYFASYFLAYDIAFPIFSKKLHNKRKRYFQGIATGCIVLVCFCLSYFSKKSFFFMPLLTDLILLAFQIPFLVLVVNIKASIKELIFSSFSAYLVYGIGNFFIPDWAGFTMLLSLAIGLFTFFFIHGFVNRTILFDKMKYREKKKVQPYYITLTKIKKFLTAPIRGLLCFRDNIDYYGAPYNTVSYLLSFFFLFIPLIFVQNIVYENALTILTIATGIGFFLALCLFLYPCWPSFLAFLFPVYWHITLSYSFAFFPIFSYFMLGHPTYGLVIIALTTFMLARFLNGKGFICLHILSSAVAIFMCYYIFKVINIDDFFISDKKVLFNFSMTYVISLLLGSIFLNNRGYKLDYTKKALSQLSQEFLHFNTNVVAMASTPTTLLDMLLASKLQEIRKSKNGTLTFKMEEDDYNLMKSLVKDIGNHVGVGSEVIRRRSRYFAPVNQGEFSYYSALNTVESAIDILKRIETAYNSIPSIIVEEDFEYYGSDQHLEQVILNLIACTFAHCGEDVKKEIIIKKGTIVYQYFEKGIPVKARPYLFTYLAYSDGNTGYYKEVGALAYVKKVMVAFGGDVLCDSRDDLGPSKNYTKYILRFSYVKNPVE